MTTINDTPEQIAAAEALAGRLALLKAQLSMSPGASFDDPLLDHKLSTAQTWVANYIGTPLPDPVPATITEACIQLAAYWFQQREAVSFGVSMQPVPFGIRELLSPYRLAVTGHDHAA